MLKPVLLCATLVLLATAGGAGGQELDRTATRALSVRHIDGNAGADRSGPPAGLDIAVSGADAIADAPMLSAVIAWVATITGLPATDDLPHVRRIPVGKTADLPRVSSLAGSQGPAMDAYPWTQGRLSAHYNDATRTIYLPDSWTGATPAEMSLLVHVMVHHLQNIAGLGYDCPQQRDEKAFDAEGRWLALFESSLLDDFAIDPDILMMSTQCIP